MLFCLTKTIIVLPFSCCCFFCLFRPLCAVRYCRRLFICLISLCMRSSRTYLCTHWNSSLSFIIFLSFFFLSVRRLFCMWGGKTNKKLWLFHKLKHMSAVHTHSHWDLLLATAATAKNGSWTRKQGMTRAQHIHSSHKHTTGAKHP